MMIAKYEFIKRYDWQWEAKDIIAAGRDKVPNLIICNEDANDDEPTIAIKST